MIVYGIRNKITGKILIGQTTRTLKIRQKEHFNMARKNKHENPHFQNAWNKYGEENFEAIILQENIQTQEELDILEEEYRLKYYPNVYNLRTGGNGGIASQEVRDKQSNSLKKRYALGEIQPWNKGKIGIYSEKTLQLIKDARAKQTFSKETLQKKSENMKGDKNHMYGTRAYDIWVEKYGKEEADIREKIRIEKLIKSNTGKHHSKETKELQRLSQLGDKNHMYGKHLSEDKKIARSKAGGFYGCWLKHDDGRVVFVENQRGFCKENNLSQGNLNGVVLGKLKSYKGWRLYKQENTNNDK